MRIVSLGLRRFNFSRSWLFSPWTLIECHDSPYQSNQISLFQTSDQPTISAPSKRVTRSSKNDNILWKRDARMNGITEKRKSNKKKGAGSVKLLVMGDSRHRDSAAEDYFVFMLLFKCIRLCISEIRHHPHLSSDFFNALRAVWSSFISGEFLIDPIS